MTVVKIGGNGFGSGDGEGYTGYVDDGDCGVVEKRKENFHQI